MSNIYQHFTKDLPVNALILDAGCGSGRDSKAFLDMGYQVKAFDASSEMVKRASKYTDLDVKHAVFDDVTATDKYDAIWCCASLLHVPEDDLPSTLAKLVAALKPNGIWYLSFKYGDTQRAKGGRLFTDVNEKRLADLVNALPPIEVKYSWVTEDNRPDRNERWLNALLIKI
ncbi:class I SAM-dependent methyltransferase [Colwellia sp. C1TZA3]|uniref:class I SAM-dependent methyltransferase n=1 Tax=Colwellia sp. C1TZA3 TaxID=2508879 RepID=UPI001CB94140|nr:class I SAM-dependent methyltransferase [Colwellia sp. C1TZA3]